MEKLLDNSSEIDINLLDKIVDTFFNGSGIEQTEAQNILTAFQQNPDAWAKVDKILQFSKSIQTRFIALSVLDRLIKTRWKLLPQDQQVNIRNFVVGMIISLCQDQEMNITASGRQLIRKSDLTLVEILKQEWPQNWPDFIPELIGSASASLSVCENSLVILKLLFEEIFDFSEDYMTQAKALRLKKSMSQEFAHVYKFVIDVLNQNESILTLNRSALECLLDYLEWIPQEYIFETNILKLLSVKFIDIPETRNLTLKCLTQISTFQFLTKRTEIMTEIILSFNNVLECLTRTVSPSTSGLKLTYSTASYIDQQFFQDLALYLTRFLKTHRTYLEENGEELRKILLTSNEYLVQLSRIEESEIFKICLDYWLELVSALYIEVQQYPIMEMLPSLQLSMSMSGSSAMNSNILKRLPLKMHIYENICTELRRTIITEKMSRPEEVIIFKDVDTGNITREFVSDTEMLNLYKSEKEVLVYLTYLNFEDTEEIISKELERQLELLNSYLQNIKENQNGWSWDNMNCLCWSIGSISCTMSEEQENFFIKGILQKLTSVEDEKISNPNDRAIYDSNVMYIVGQYPRFLKNNWSFLLGIIEKLFQCMHNNNEGIQNMACDTFVKIVNKCKYHFTVNKPEDKNYDGPFVQRIIENIDLITSDLKLTQLYTFYETCGLIIKEERNSILRDQLLVGLMRSANLTWLNTFSQPIHDNSGEEIIKMLLKILEINISVANATGRTFAIQLENIYSNILNLFKSVTELIYNEVNSNGSKSVNSSKMRVLRNIRTSILILIKIFLTDLNPNDLDKYFMTLVDPILEMALNDYNINLPELKDPEVLCLADVLVRKGGQRYPQNVPLIIKYTFNCTLDMIKTDFNEFPTLRLEFYKLLRIINLKNFGTLMEMDSPTFFQLFFDSILWTFKHHNREIEEVGLQTAIEVLKNIETVNDTSSAEAFYQSYYLTFISETFYALSDPDHKPAFAKQALLLRNLLMLTYENRIPANILKSNSSQEDYSNTTYLNQYITNLLTKTFSTLTLAQVEGFLKALMKNYNNVAIFSSTIRDFLIQIKEIGGDPSDYLFSEK